jgi:hypothetical protein
MAVSVNTGLKQPRQMVHETISKKPITKYWAGGVAQGQGPEFKPQYHKKTLKI